MEEWALEVLGTIVAGVAVGIILYLFFKKRAERQLDKRQIAKVKKGEVVQAHDKSRIVIDKSHGKRVFHEVGGSPSAEKVPQRKSENDRRKAVSERKTMNRKISVEPGCSERVCMYLEKGSRITGLAEEEYSYDFHFYIVDGEDYALLGAGEDPEKPLIADFDRPVYHFDETIPHTGNWFFVFDAFGMKVRRDIDFTCTIIEKGRA